MTLFINAFSVTAPFFAIPENISRGGGHSIIITSSARAVEPRLNTFRSQSYAAQPNVSKKQLYNKAFESWVARYYPEVTHQPLEEVSGSRCFRNNIEIVFKVKLIILTNIANTR